MKHADLKKKKKETIKPKPNNNNKKHPPKSPANKTKQNKKLCSPQGQVIAEHPKFQVLSLGGKKILIFLKYIAC